MAIFRIMVLVIALQLLPAAAYAAELKEYKTQTGEKPLYAFAAIADPQVGRIAGVEKQKFIFNTIKEMKEKPDFILVLGDISNEKSFTQAWADANVGVPLHITFGNHESEKSREFLRKKFKEDLGERDFYSFKHKGSLFIVLCNAGVEDHVGHFYSEFIKGGDQFQWLEQELRKNDKKMNHIFIAGHVPPDPYMRNNGNAIKLSDQMRLSGLLKKYKVTAMFFGHLHKRQRFHFTGVPTYVMRSSHWNKDENEPVGFNIVKVYKNGIQTEFIEAKVDTSHYEKVKKALSGTSGTIRMDMTPHKGKLPEIPGVKSSYQPGFCSVTGKNTLILNNDNPTRAYQVFRTTDPFLVKKKSGILFASCRVRVRSSIGQSGFFQLVLSPQCGLKKRRLFCARFSPGYVQTLLGTIKTPKKGWINYDIAMDVATGDTVIAVNGKKKYGKIPLSEGKSFILWGDCSSKISGKVELEYVKIGIVD